MYASIKEAREAAKKLEEEKLKTKEEVEFRVNDLQVSGIFTTLIGSSHTENVFQTNKKCQFVGFLFNFIPIYFLYIIALLNVNDF